MLGKGGKKIIIKKEQILGNRGEKRDSFREDILLKPPLEKMVLLVNHTYFLQIWPGDLILLPVAAGGHHSTREVVRRTTNMNQFKN